MEITKENIAFTKRTLYNYYHLRKLEMEYRRLAFEWEERIQNETGIQGVHFSDVVKDGCSVHYTKDSYLHQLIKEQASFDQEAQRCMIQANSLDKQNHIEVQLQAIHKDQRMLLLAVFKQNMSYPDISKAFYRGLPSKQAVSDRVNHAIMALMEW